VCKCEEQWSVDSMVLSHVTGPGSCDADHIGDALNTLLGSHALPPTWTAARVRQLGGAFLEYPRGVQALSCQATGTDVQLHDGIARVSCPVHCEREPSAVAIGALVHPLRSSVCMAALADGVLSGRGGQLMVTKVAGLPSYTEVDSGIASSQGSVGDSGDAFHVYATDPITEKQPLPPVQDIHCTTTYADMDPLLRSTGSSMVVHCPVECSRAGILEGSSVYSERSSICRAATHAKVITNEGGKVVVTAGQGQDRYYGTASGSNVSADAPWSKESFTVSLPLPDVIIRTLQRTHFM